MDEDDKLILYKSVISDVSVNTRFADKDVWLTLDQIAMIYQITHEKVLMHISNIYNEGELDREKTCKRFLAILQKGWSEEQREMDHYNLDMIDAIAYRVRSPIAVDFRKRVRFMLELCNRDGYPSYDAGDDDRDEEEFEVDWAGTKQWAIKTLERGGMKVIKTSPQSDFVSKEEGEFYSSLPYALRRLLAEEH